MKSAEYWKKRQEEKLSNILNKSDVTSNYISKIYHKAYLYTKEQIQDVFDKYKESHGLSLQEAKLLLSQLNNPHDYDELKKKLQNNLTSEQRKELLKKLDAPVYQYRINKLKDMQSKVDDLMKNVYNIEVEKNTDSYIDSAFDAYYRNVYNFQQGTGVAYQFNELDPKLIDKMLHSKWSGKNYSSRVWSNTTNLADSLKEEMMLGLLTNKTEKEMAETLMNKFAVGAYQARRLIQTESAAMSAFADQLAYEDAGIEKEMFIAVHDSRTSKVCQQHDRSVVDISKAQVGVNAPPLHPNCRSYMIPYIEGITDKMKKRQRNPETGRDEVLNVNENYEQWLKRQQQEHGIDDVDTFKENVMKQNNIRKTVDEHIEKDTPKIKIVSDENASTLKKYKKKEIVDIARKNEEFINNHLSKETKWSGNIVVDDSAEKYGKLWSCDIATSSETSPMIIMHEQLHARSVSYFDNEIYKKYRNIEEASVQLLTQEISDKESIEIVESMYDESVDCLRKLNELSGLYKNDYDFALALFNIDLPERLDWLETKVYDSIVKKGDIDLMIKFSDIISKLY